MKGIVFTEFLDLVEKKFGLEMVDTIIKSSNLTTGGAYTAVGTYQFGDMVQLLQNLSKNTGISTDDLLYVFAEHFFETLKQNYASMLNAYSDPIVLLSSIENHIHVEVLKIYPDAELPTFQVIEKTDTSLVLIYKSSRAMHHFGLGLMHKAFSHFNATASIIMEKLKPNGTEVKFIIQKN